MWLLRPAKNTSGLHFHADSLNNQHHHHWSWGGTNYMTLCEQDPFQNLFHCCKPDICEGWRSKFQLFCFDYYMNTQVSALISLSQIFAWCFKERWKGRFFILCVALICFCLCWFMSERCFMPQTQNAKGLFLKVWKKSKIKANLLDYVNWEFKQDSGALQQFQPWILGTFRWVQCCPIKMPVGLKTHWLYTMFLYSLGWNYFQLKGLLIHITCTSISTQYQLGTEVMHNFRSSSWIIKGKTVDKILNAL